MSDLPLVLACIAMLAVVGLLVWIAWKHPDKRTETERRDDAY